ncbi:MAG: LON peptidase substrate-binding domain-containing protein [Oceanicoccus sp.]
MDTIPLFPLHAVLFPHGRMPLQVYESRYLDLISRCMKENSGFGVVWLKQGPEAYQSNGVTSLQLGQFGTYARVVDWDSLPNGLLGVTIEGSDRFRLLSSYQKNDHLHMGEVEWIATAAKTQLPENFAELEGLLSTLLDHPHVTRLKLDPVVEDVETLGCVLAQLLPIDESIKFDLLTTVEPLDRLDRIMALLDQYSE